MQIETRGGTVIDDIEVRESFIGKMRGLMFQTKGRVLLRFSYPDRHGIWMLGMRFPIDIAFIDAENQVIDVRRDVQPVSWHPGTWAVYRPSHRCMDVLEVEAGLLEENGVEIGSELSYHAHGSNS